MDSALPVDTHPKFVAFLRECLPDLTDDEIAWCLKTYSPSIFAGGAAATDPSDASE